MSCINFEYRSPPRTRRSSTSSTGSSGNGGYSGGLNLTSCGLATAKRASRRRSRSPSPRVQSTCKLNAPVDAVAGRRSRSPTPRTTDLLEVRGVGCRSRSVTPSNRRRKQRSVSPSLQGGGGGDRLSVPNNGQLMQKPSNDSCNRSRSPSATHRDCSGVDDTPTPKISLNFTSELATEIGDRLSRESSVDTLQRGGGCSRKSSSADVTSYYGGGDDDIAIDTSSTCRVSDNFRGTEQYHMLNPTPVTAIERRHSTVKEEESEVDTTPFCRVSDNLRVVCSDTPLQQSVGRKKSHSSGHHRDAAKEPVGTDSGSEVSDEGYRSLGVVTTPPANSNTKSVQKINGKRMNI